MARTSLSPERKLELARRWYSLKTKCGDAYKEMDSILEELVAGCRVGESIEVAKGITIELRDNFKGKNKVWKPAGINRLDLAVVVEKPAD